MTASRRQELTSLSLLAIALFLVGTNAFVLAGVLPHVARSIDVSIVAMGYTLTAYAVIVAALSPTLSMLFHAKSPVVLLASGLGLAATGTLISAAAPTFPWFLMGRVVAAVGAAAIVPTAFALAPALVPLGRRARALAYVGLGFTAALAIGAPLGTAIASLAGWRMALTSIAICMLLTCLAAFVLIAAPETRSSGPSRGRRGAVVRDPAIALLLSVRVMLTCAFQVVYLYIAIVADDVTHGDGVKLAVLMSAYGIGGVLGGFTGGWMTDLRGSGRSGTEALGLLTVILAALAALTSMTSAVLVFALWGFTAALAGVPQQSRLMEHRPEVAAISLAWNSTALYVGLAVASLLGATLVPYGPRAVVLGGVVTSFLALVLFALGLGRVRRLLRLA